MGYRMTATCSSTVVETATMLGAGASSQLLVAGHWDHGYIPKGQIFSVISFSMN